MGSLAPTSAITRPPSRTKAFLQFSCPGHPGASRQLASFLLSYEYLCQAPNPDVHDHHGYHIFLGRGCRLLYEVTRPSILEGYWRNLRSYMTRHYRWCTPPTDRLTNMRDCRGWKGHPNHKYELGYTVRESMG